MHQLHTLAYDMLMPGQPGSQMATDIGNILKNLIKWTEGILGSIIILVAVICIGVGVVKLGMKLLNYQQSQEKFGVIFGLIFFGGLFGLGGGWMVAQALASGSSKTFKDIQNGSTGMIDIMQSVSYLRMLMS